MTPKPKPRPDRMRREEIARSHCRRDSSSAFMLWRPRSKPGAVAGGHDAINACAGAQWAGGIMIGGEGLVEHRVHLLWLNFWQSIVLRLGETRCEHVDDMCRFLTTHTVAARLNPEYDCPTHAFHS